MASSATETKTADDDHHQHLALELTARDPDSPDMEKSASGPSLASDEIIPLLNQQNQRPRFNIFSASYTRRKPRKLRSEFSNDFFLGLCRSKYLNGSRYSGLLCMALSSTLYLIMELVSDSFSVQPIPLFETAFMRCAIILILSYLWKLLVSRALVGYLSLFSFIFSIQMLPLSQAIVLSFVNPVMASIAARVVLHEKLKITDIGALVCSFFGVIFIFVPTLTVQGLFSSFTGGISYCLIKAAAKASEQPVITVLSFGLVACPAAAICMFSLESFVLPAFDTLISMIVLGLLAFCAEVLLARGLQLEKISKAANILYIEVVLSQLYILATRKAGSTGLFSRLVGCLLILISVSYAIYVGPAKHTE
ncbi:hypothetical protein EUTSA_v10002583mg [Eutrema salsugineum]|uniref:EamA domain-containing protein n=1 Tax=Eutrema salsugineum TaxID=72664 RepID=V4MWY7_EUTSA|nr:hypothetical protein EUTSA_v10002583mg [Eutrema salsugineum]